MRKFQIYGKGPLRTNDLRMLQLLEDGIFVTMRLIMVWPLRCFTAESKKALTYFTQMDAASAVSA